MTKKLVLLITSEEDVNITVSIDDLLKKNKYLYNIVTQHKNQITTYYNNKSWDRFKKLSNEYELIFTTPNTGSNISKYVPVSRSFFKLWEILHDFKDEIFIEDSMKCMFLAEGPGGFAESFMKYRFSTFKDEYYGITLKSNNNKNIPDWRLDNIKITYGIDGTGNLYNFDNILYLVKQYNANSFDFITADGGFDFSTDFNNQEDQSTRLILAEILTAICLQKTGGKLVLKIYDMFNEETLKIIHLLKEFYDNIYMIKPFCSRPANSERYILCTIYKKNEKYKNLLTHVIKDYTQENLNTLFNEIPYNLNILNNLIIYNTYYSLRQIYYIERTIGYINKYKNIYNSSEARAILDKHKQKSINWCIKYKLEYNS
jgi:23S rRNA U2552 (ribose-2'-O)-methylase RlmE/FtsJ